MKYINKVDDLKSVWVITEPMAVSLKDSGIGFDNLDELPKHLGKLFATEIAGVYKLQDTIEAKLGVVRAPITFNEAKDDVSKALLLSALDNAPSNETSFIFETRNKYYVHGMTNGFVICVVDRASQNTMPGWTQLSADSLPSAMLEAIYSKVGYLEAHFKEIVKSSTVGTFSLADVYKLVSVSQ